MACIILGVFTYVSDRLKKRAVIAAGVPLVVIAGYAIAIGTASPGGGFFAMFLCAGGECPFPLLTESFYQANFLISVYTYNTLLVAWVSNNIKPEHKRSAALPFLISIANVSGVAASQVYPDYSAPRYAMCAPDKLGSLTYWNPSTDSFWAMPSASQWSFLPVAGLA